MSEILFYIVIFMTNIIQGITGFAGTILAMPFAIHLVGYSVAKPVLNLLGILASTYMVLKGPKNVNKKQLKRVVLFMSIGIVLGLILKQFIGSNDRILYIILGIFVLLIGARGLIAYLIYFMQKNYFTPYRSPHKVIDPDGSDYIEKGTTPQAMANLVIAGIIHGIFVSGGPLIVSYLSSHTRNKEEFVRTVSAVWIVLNSIVLISDLFAGAYTYSTIRTNLIAVPFLFGGMFLGGFLYKHMSQTVFTLLTYVLLCIAGISLFA